MNISFYHHMKKIFILLIILSGAPYYICAQRVAIKTNLVADATTTMNLGLELGLSKKTSLEVNVNYNPWLYEGKEVEGLGFVSKKFKHLLIQPEFRYWFCERFNGHFIGIHAHWGKYNVGALGLGDDDFANPDYESKLWGNLGKNRYEGDFYGAGISYGYQWVLSKHWNLEGNIGVGYARIQYDKYECQKCGTILESDHYNYFGPTKAAISIIYLF